MENKQVSKHPGSCHCGKVKFEAEFDASQGASQCNCSICTKLGCVGMSMKPDAFKLVAGAADRGAYKWGEVSTRYFCKHCGVYLYGEGDLPELGGAFVSINLNCVDDIDLSTIKITHWDGRHNNWQAGTRDTRWPL
jgi:hypothetical protein